MTAPTVEKVPGRWQRMRYRGPSADALFEDYARQRRIDDAAPIVAHRRIVVDAPVAKVWDVLATPTRWPAVDPKIRDVELAGNVDEGVRLTWRNGSTRLSSRFAVVDPFTELTWTGTTLGSRVVHRHVLTAIDDRRTALFTEESMSGALVVLFFSEAKLDTALERWLAAFAKAAEAADSAAARVDSRCR